MGVVYRALDSHLNRHRVVQVIHSLEPLAPAIVSADLRPAVDSVASAVWVLWHNDLPRVWDVLLRWSNDASAALKSCAAAVLREGLEKERVTADQAIGQITEWLSSEDVRQRDAGEALAGELSLEHLERAAGALGDRQDEEKQRALPSLVRRLFAIDPFRAVKLVRTWADRGGFASVIKEGTKDVYLPEDLTAQDYDALCRMLLPLEARVTGAKSAIRRLRMQARDLRSKISGQGGQPTRPQSSEQRPQIGHGKKRKR
jgi:hypothetical protein